MTNEDILKLAQKHFDYQGGWVANTEDLLKFARCLLDYGFSEGHKDGYSEGVNEEQMYPENAWSDL